MQLALLLGAVYVFESPAELENAPPPDTSDQLYGSPAPPDTVKVLPPIVRVMLVVIVTAPVPRSRFVVEPAKVKLVFQIIGRAVSVTTTPLGAKRVLVEGVFIRTIE